MARLPRYVLFAVLSLTFGSAAQAQWAVVDVRAIAQMTQQLSVLRQQLQTVQNQLTQAQREYQSITGSRGMDQLLRGTVRNYLPEDWRALQDALDGLSGSYGALASQLQSVLQGNAVLSEDQVGRLSVAEREQLQARRRTAALLQVTSREALEASSERFVALQQLIDAIPTATDQKAVLDLQARISAEQAMLQNEQTKLMLLYHATEAEELARRQRSSELAIQNRGSLRSIGAVGLVP
ncbi:MAG: type IV secretion system protein [Steroidobacteraceae bacterium]